MKMHFKIQYCKIKPSFKFLIFKIRMSMLNCILTLINTVLERSLRGMPNKAAAHSVPLAVIPCSLLFNWKDHDLHFFHVTSGGLE